MPCFVEGLRDEVSFQAPAAVGPTTCPTLGATWRGDLRGLAPMRGTRALGLAGLD